jgi:hypothetical protein
MRAEVGGGRAHIVVGVRSIRVSLELNSSNIAT